MPLPEHSHWTNNNSEHRRLYMGLYEVVAAISPDERGVMNDFEEQTTQGGLLGPTGRATPMNARGTNIATTRRVGGLLATSMAIAVLFLSALVLALPGGANASEFSETSVEYQFWVAVNEARADEGLEPLGLQMELSQNSERVLDEALEGDGRVSVSEGQLSTVADSITGQAGTTGVAICCGSTGFPNIADHIAGFLSSPSTPLLSPIYTHVGFGTAPIVDPLPGKSDYFHVIVHLVEVIDEAPTCGDELATITGTSSADVIVGTTGVDVIFGAGGADHIVALEGDDLLCGGGGHDTIEGGLGDDIAYGQGGADSISLGVGDDTAYGGPGYDTLTGGVGHDNLQGGGGEDRLIGGDGVDRLYGQFGDDYLDGGMHDDQLYGAHGDDRAFGGPGDDRVQGAGGDDTLDGGPGDDVLFGQNDNDFLNGSDGNDTIYAASGDDRLFGGNGDDNLQAGSGNDELRGQDGVDVLYGQQGDDIVDGGAEEDTCYEGPGDNTVIDCP